VGSDAEWIESRTGIQGRHFASGEATSDLALRASERALDDAGCTAADLDAIVFATLSPDVVFPGSGVFLQRKLGVTDIPALDVRNQCSGFLYGLSVAQAWLESGAYQRVLLVGAEVHSAGLDFSERGRAVSVLFGDGAGAWVLEKTGDERRSAEFSRLLGVRLGSDGRGAENLMCRSPGSATRPHIDSATIEAGDHFPTMKGRAVFRAAVETLEREVGSALRDYDLSPEEILFVPHQANLRISEMVAQRLGIPLDRVVATIRRHGNTTAASIPTAWDVARRDGRIASGTPVVVAAFGSGYTWGTAVFEG
jgi:3-oxoacyl-[acyl-carrier-protein] synthase-3